jgi:hypothetical protein
MKDAKATEPARIGELTPHEGALVLQALLDRLGLEILVENRAPEWGNPRALELRERERRE